MTPQSFKVGLRAIKITDKSSIKPSAALPALASLTNYITLVPKAKNPVAHLAGSCGYYSTCF